MHDLVGAVVYGIGVIVFYVRWRRGGGQAVLCFALYFLAGAMGHLYQFCGGLSSMVIWGAWVAQAAALAGMVGWLIVDRLARRHQ